MSALIHFEFSLQASLDAEDLWPDGLPSEITEEVVHQLIKDCGGVNRAISDWDLGQIECYVKVYP